MLEKITNSGREAFYISTDGFDKTLIHLSKAAFEDNQEVSNRIQEALEVSDNEEYFKSEFSLEFKKTDKYIKSNLHPIVFPKEVFQFEFDYKDEKPWKHLRSITNTTNICAIPFKGKVFAYGTLTEIRNVFKDGIKYDIKREPISKYDVENVSAFKALMLQVVLKYFSSSLSKSS